MTILTEIAAQLPDNNSEQITPAILRGVLSDMVADYGAAAVAAAAAAVVGLASTAYVTTALTPYRVPLTASRTYFVDGTNGNDGNSGLAAGAGNAFQTITKAMAVAAGLDCGPWQLTISVAAGTYTTAVVLPFVLGSLPPILTGAGSTTIISTGASTAISNASGIAWQVNNLKVTTSGGAADGLNASLGSKILFQAVEFGACGESHMQAIGYSTIKNTGTYTISGGAQAHMLANASNIIISFTGSAITGTPNFSLAFAFANRISLFNIGNGASTWTGSATGSRYFVGANSIIDTAGAATTAFPGSTAGTTSNGGLYI